MSSNMYESHKFSEDISRDMRIPERIGAKGALDTGSKGFSVNPDYPTFSNIVEDMNIPDKILATGEAASASTPSYDPLDPNFQIRPSDLIPIDLPPDTITLDKIRYPDIRADAGTSSAAPQRRRGRSSGGSGVEFPNGADLPGSAASANNALLAPPNGNLSAAILRLQKRLEALEAENEQRRRRELVLYPAIGLYFLFKIVGWILRPKRIAGGGSF